MGFKYLHLKLKVFKLKRFLGGGGGGGGKGKRESENGNGMKPSWMVPVSHGYYVVEEEERSFMKRTGELDLGFDSVVVQREQIEEHELWFFGVFDPLIGDGVTKYIQSHLFHNKHPKDQIIRKSKETMKKAYICARAKMRGTKNPDERRKVGSASTIVIDGENLVVANMGDYKAVVCKEGEAYQFTRRHQLTTKRHWSRKFFPGAIRIPKVRIIASDSGTTVPTKSSELIVGSERIDADTEFIILASTGIWEVMKHQEAVSLIRHIEDPQEAAECLAKEALARMSRRNVSCLVIRFD